MKIAFVVHDFTRTLGHGRYTYELARRFSREHDVHVFCNFADRADAEGVQFHHVPAIRANALATITTFTLPATVRMGSGFDIIHAQGACSLRFNVITAHICNAGWAEAQRASRVARTWRQVVFERVITPIEAATYRWSPHAQVIAISGQVQDEIAHYYGRADGVSVIHHGVDRMQFAPVDASGRRGIRRRLGLPDARFIALFVGDLRKGAAVALEVLARTPEMHLVLVSRSAPGPYAVRAAELGVSDRTAFHGATNDVASYYAMADAFLFPSPYDAFGMVVSEAMASGLPVITTRSTGASELIAEGRSGFVVERSNDADAMAHHIARLVNEPRLRYTVGQAAREAVIDHTWDHVARRTMQVYLRAIERS